VSKGIRVTYEILCEFAHPNVGLLLGLTKTADGKLIKKIGNRIPHDFRRTAVRNLERAGVSRSDAMKMVGHKTESIYRRYAIADEKSMKEAAGKLDQFYAIDQQPTETTK
jgi:integrase